MSKINDQYDKALAQTKISLSGHSTVVSTGGIKTQRDINILFTHCNI
jgi:hypothetical protein